MGEKFSSINAAQFVGSKGEFAVEDHFDGSADGKGYVGAAGAEYTGEPGESPNCAADAGTHAGVSAGDPRESADASSGCSGLSHGAGVAAFIAIACDAAFGTVDTAAAVGTAGAGAKIFFDAIWQRDGIEAKV